MFSPLSIEHVEAANDVIVVRASATGLREGKLAETTLQRWQQLNAGVGLPDCSRRLGLAMNTVKRYTRAATPERIQWVPSTGLAWSIRIGNISALAVNRSQMWTLR